MHPHPAAAPALQEYRSAAHVLKGARTNRSKFLRLYSTYLAGEKRRE